MGWGGGHGVIERRHSEPVANNGLARNLIITHNPLVHSLVRPIYINMQRTRVVTYTVAGKGHAQIFFFIFSTFHFPDFFQLKKFVCVFFLLFSRLFTSVFPSFHFRK